jgi:8-oxo-dGTP diphosphatase
MSPQAPKNLRFAVLASDVALFTIKDNELLVRLIRVTRPPHFPNNPGLPGGILHEDETAEDAANRNIETKGLVSAKKIYLEQLYTFSEINRDRRNRVVAVAYSGFIAWEKLSEAERTNSVDVYWLSVRKAKNLAYDHEEMLRVALARLRTRARYTTLIQKLMPKEFTLTELEQAYESVLGEPLDKRNFRKKILKLNILKELPAKKTGGRFRPAQLYSFASAKVDEIEVL